VEEPGDEEKQFIHRLASGMPMETAARGTLTDVDASPAVAKRTAMQALGDTTVKAYFIDLMEEADLTPLEMMQALKRNLTTRKYGIHQATGERVDLGDDGMTQLTAVKLMMQSMGVLGGAPKVEPTDQKEGPVQINIVFPGRDIRSKKEDVIIDGDDSYSARS